MDGATAPPRILIHSELPAQAKLRDDRVITGLVRLLEVGTRAVVIAFFLALVLALAEAVSIQSMALTLHALRAAKPDWRWFWNALRREFGSSLLLGAACGTLVLAIVFVWRHTLGPAAVIGLSVAGSLCIACLAGVIVPSLLHALRLDPKIAAGPVTLAVADVLTLLLYFSLASWLL